MINDETKCISPWIGFSFILLVCFMITAAIFFKPESRLGSGRKRQDAGFKKVAARAQFSNAQRQAEPAGNKLVF